MADTAVEEKVEHPLFAGVYLRMASGRKAKGEDEYRRRLLEGPSGRVIEVGARNGLNFPFYPDALIAGLAVEPEPLLREAGTGNARATPVPVDVVDGVSGRLPAEGESFDAGVARSCCARLPTRRARWPSSGA
jgi:hypothetical protein